MQITLQGKPLKQFSTQSQQILQATDRQGHRYLAKLISLRDASQKGYDECLQFNIEVLEQTDNFVFQDNILPITTRIANKEYMGFITGPYECTLQKYLERETINESQAMKIFQQVVKAIYSLHIAQYWHRNIRPEHFVLSGKTWKLESLVLKEDCSKANGSASHYLWSPKHEPPEFQIGKKYQEEEYNQFTVWNLGSILLQLIICSNRLSTKQEMNKFKGKMFTFEALGIKSERIARLSTDFKELLGGMLHHNPQKRTSLYSLFLNPFVSKEVALHAAKPKQKNIDSKFSDRRRIAVLSVASNEILKDLSFQHEEREKKEQQSIICWKINSVVDDESFINGLNGFSKQVSYRNQTEMVSTHPFVRKAIELYKSYYDQSQLLALGVECIDFLKFPSLKPEEAWELILLIKHSIILASLINLSFLAKGFNQNRNILHLSGEEFSLFQSSRQYEGFQRLVNTKCKQRAMILQRLRAEIRFTKENLLNNKYGNAYSLLSRDYLNTTFIDIKNTYRYIVKKAYDSICEEYNQNFEAPISSVLAQRAMLVTYCLTVDKLYIKAQIPDNFRYYFQWSGKPPSNFVPLNSFKDYILKAPKNMLIENSKYILKKYFAV